jgi:thiol-disulfide isomerase/thioredoxin
MPPGIGDPAPPFSGQDVLTGQSFSLADYQDEVVLITFNGITWCAPCQYEAPVIEALSKDFDVGVQFVMVASWCDVGALPTALQQFGITMPAIPDPGGDIAGQYGVDAVPTLFVLKKGLTVCGKIIGTGGLSTDELYDEISAMLVHCGAPEPVRIPPLHASEWEAVAHILFGVVQDGGGVAWPGGKIPPWSPLRTMAPELRTTLAALAINQLARGVGNRDQAYALQRTALRAAQSALATFGERLDFAQSVEQQSMSPPR